MFHLDYTNIRENYIKLIIAETYFLIGFGYSFSSFLIPNLEKETFLSGSDAIWIIITGVILKPLGIIICTYTNDKFGRRGTLRLKLLIAALGWIIVILSTNRYIFYIGRLLTSFSSGFISDGNSYIEEMCSKSPNSESLNLLFTVAGYLGSGLVQYYFSWKIMAFLAIILSLAAVFQTNCIPESKHWYMMKNRRREAILSSLWIQKDKTIQEVQEELNKVERSILMMPSNINLFHILKNPQLTKSLIACIIIIITKTASGYFISSLFLVTVYQSLGINYNPNVCAIISVFFNLIFFTISVSAIRKHKPSSIFCISSIIMIGTMTLVISYLCLFQVEKPISWILIAGLVTYLTLNVSMFYPIISIMLADVFSISLRDRILELYQLLESILVIIYASAIYLYMISFGIGYVFAYFVCNATISFIMVIYFLSNTNTPLHYEFVDLFENENHSGPIDQQKLLQSIIDEESSS